MYLLLWALQQLVEVQLSNIELQRIIEGIVHFKLFLIYRLIKQGKLLLVQFLPISRRPFQHNVSLNFDQTEFLVADNKRACFMRVMILKSFLGRLLYNRISSPQKPLLLNNFDSWCSVFG